MAVDQSDGAGAAWAMGFELRQKEKLRVIDDFLVAGVNQTQVSVKN